MFPKLKNIYNITIPYINRNYSTNLVSLLFLSLRLTTSYKRIPTDTPSYSILLFISL